MKLYKIIFNEYGDKNKTVVTNGKGYCIHGVDDLIVKECDIKGLNFYGNGIKEKIYVGKLSEC
ncbi:hypothetical protein [Clostridium sp.]|uniref:hypothetical protein n=1 Tax=Clostridium sp. TaxID=1506 RepID=UPI00261611FA|nr:hypothetical protein [Clostridium sp.]